MSPALLPLSIHFPGKLVFGPGILASLADELQHLNVSRVYLLIIEPLQPLAAAEADGLRKSLQDLVSEEILTLDQPLNHV